MNRWAKYTWVEIAPGLEYIHPNGPAVALIARDAGKRPGDVAEIRLTHAPADVLPIIMFDDGSFVCMEGAGQS